MSNGAQGGSAGINTRSYKSGSIVYMEGDKSDNIYILKTGRVILTTKKVEDRVWVEVKENVKPGEFFGVKSALGRYPRDETAQTFGDTMVLVLSLADFERLVLKNLNVVKKMLRVFSNQLRSIGKKVREVLGESEVTNPDVELFKIGEYYYKAGRLQEAQYAYRKFLEYYPDTKQAGAARERIKAIQSGQAGMNTGGFDEPDMGADIPAASPRDSFSDDMTDFSIDEEPSGGASDVFSDSAAPAKSSARSPLAGEMDEFLMEDEPSGGKTDDFSFDEPAPANHAGYEEESEDINEIFYRAMKLFSEGQYDEAISLYEAVLNFKSLKNESERKTFEKAHFEIGRCYYKLRRFKEALESFSALIKKFPNSELLKSGYLYIGMIFEDTKNAEKALGYYQKIASMEPKDQITKEAVNRIAKLKNQGRR